MASYPHIVRQPCPECRSHRTIQMANDGSKEKLYCPDCAYSWTVGIDGNRREISIAGSRSRNVVGKSRVG